MAQWLLSLLRPKAIVKESLKPKHNRTQLVGYNKCLLVCIIFFGIVKMSIRQFLMILAVDFSKSMERSVVVLF